MDEKEELEEIKYGTESSIKAKENIKDVVLRRNFTEEERQQLMELFNGGDYMLTDLTGMAKKAEHRINLTDDKPIRRKTYVLPYSTIEKLKEELKGMEK